MAIGSVVHTFTLTVADVDRGVYDDVSLRVARHPSETDAFMITRVLAYALELTEGITFGGTVSSTEEPAVLVKDLTGRITTWIEVGAPDAERLHFANKLADRTVVYTHREPVKMMQRYEGKKIHEAHTIVVRAFEPDFIDDAARSLDRRNTATVTLTDSRVYLDLNGASLSSDLTEHRVA